MTHLEIKPDVRVHVLRAETIMLRAALQGGLQGDELDRMERLLAQHIAWIDYALTGKEVKTAGSFREILANLRTVTYVTLDGSQSLRLDAKACSLHIN